MVVVRRVLFTLFMLVDKMSANCHSGFDTWAGATCTHVCDNTTIGVFSNIGGHNFTLAVCTVCWHIQTIAPSVVYNPVSGTSATV